MPSPDCSGHGTLMPNGLCICDSAWNAGSDLFQLQVYGPYALDCVLPDAAVIVFWAITLLVCLLKQKESVHALADKNPTLQKLQRSFYTDQLTRLLVLDLVIATPLLIVACCLKLADRQAAVLGSDLAFTLTLCTGVLLTASIFCKFQVLSFRILLMANFYQNAKTARILRQDEITQTLLALSYGILTVLPTLCAFALDQSVGPVQSGEWIIIVVRNIGIVLWQLFGLMGSALLLREVTKMHSTTQGSSNKTSDGPSLATVGAGSAKRVVEFLKSNFRGIFRTNAILLVLYAIFSIPFTWPFQTLSSSIAVTAMLRNYSLGKIVLASRKAAASGRPIASNNALVKVESENGDGKSSSLMVESLAVSVSPKVGV